MWGLMMFTLCAIGVLVIIVYDKQSKVSQKVSSRFRAEIPLSPGASTRKTKLIEGVDALVNELSSLLGFDFSAKFLGLYLVAILLINFISAHLLSFKAGLIVSFVFITISVLFFLHRRRKHRALIVSQLPLFIDQLIRSLGTGRSLESAMRIVTTETPVPLSAILERVVRATDLGASFTDAMVKEMWSDRIKELEMVALSVKISNSYGSSPKDMLQSVMHMINNQEQARRELAAMTGETKISALILMLTPVSILAYMLLMNPSYIDLMTSNPSGISALKFAVALQVIGAFLFWRMLKSL
jgi:tight adherence protein B